MRDFSIKLNWIRSNSKKIPLLCLMLQWSVTSWLSPSQAGRELARQIWRQHSLLPFWPWIISICRRQKNKLSEVWPKFCWITYVRTSAKSKNLLMWKDANPLWKVALTKLADSSYNSIAITTVHSFLGNPQSMGTSYSPHISNLCVVVYFTTFYFQDEGNL